MKKVLIALLCAVTFTACTDNDAEVIDTSQAITQVATQSETAANELDSVVQYRGGSSMDVFEFANNKVFKHSTYNGMLTNYVDYFFDNDGQLAAMTGKDAEGNVYFERTVTYDAEKRIIGKSDTYYNFTQNTTSVENVTYAYEDTNNTITAHFDSFNEFSTDRVYHFNTEGLLSKITKIDSTNIQVFVYDNNNIAQMGNGSIMSGFLYDNTTVVKGEYLNMYRNQFKTYSNFVVYNGFMVARVVANKYITQVTDYSGVANFTYQYNSEGYPVEIDEVYPNTDGLKTVIVYK